MNNSGKVKIDCISITGNSQNRECILRIYTKEMIGIFEKVIRQAWYDCVLCRKRRMTIKNNEIRIFLKKGDTVQKYIDNITMIIQRIKYYENHSGKLNIKQRMKHAVLKRMSSSRYYILEHRPVMKKVQ